MALIRVGQEDFEGPAPEPGHARVTIEKTSPRPPLEADAIAKINAGAMLTFAVWSLPKDTILALMRDAPQAFQKAYMRATEAYGVGEQQ